MLAYADVEDRPVYAYGGYMWTVPDVGVVSQFDWTDASAAWPVLTSATVSWVGRSPSGTEYTAAGSVVTPTGASKKVRLELTAVQSADIVAVQTGGWTFGVWATLAGGNVVNLVAGSVPVLDTPGP